MSGDPGVSGARYRWPEHDDLRVEVVGSTGPVVGSTGPLIAIGTVPHSNEPLGTAVGDLARGAASYALIGPIDPPPARHRFPMPTGPVAYAARGYLPPLAEQVEFAHCDDPVTPAERRAGHLRECLQALRPQAFVMLHNDVGARAPYLYAKQPWPEVERRLRSVIDDGYDRAPVPDLAWTRRLGERTYEFFPCSRIGVHGSQSAGLFIEDRLALPTLTLELPMFHWGRAELARRQMLEVMSAWVAEGGSHGGATGRLVRDVRHAVDGHDISMVPAATTARTIWAVLDGITAALATSTHRAEGIPA